MQADVGDGGSSDARPLRDAVCIVTGAARGLGRAHALHLADLGAAVVVNDVRDAAAVATEIRARGARSAASDHDVSDWTQAGALIRLAVETFGGLHVLVNNAGVLRDRTLANMSEEEWDTVVRVHLKGHAAPSHHAMAYWRAKHKAGEQVAASIVHTTSLAGIFPNFGQTNYAAAKAGIIALSHTLALEGAQIGVRSNAIAPSAHTPMTPGGRWDLDTGDQNDAQPQHVSRIVGLLVRPQCTASGQLIHVLGPQVTVYSSAQPAAYHWHGSAASGECAAQAIPALTATTAFDALEGCARRMRAARDEARTEKIS